VNLILLYDTDFITATSVTLSDDRYQHIRNIHQSKAGDSVRVGKLNGLMGTGIIQSIDQHAVKLTVELDQQPPAKLPLTIILALPRPKMIRRLFRSVAELGVEELIVINSYKVEKSFWLSPALDEQKVQFYLASGLQQAKDTQLPKVTFNRLFKPFVEDELPRLIKDCRGLIAHPGIGQPCPHTIESRSVLAIGPEGGFTDYEVGKFIDVGFEGIHLGERILRVENALTAITSKLYQ
jgi:16S rRNA (uracil1498-N3)-methyltransferase